MSTGPEELPAELNPRHWLQTGAEVIEHGLPELPPRLNYQMVIPFCYWAAAAVRWWSSCDSTPIRKTGG